MEGRGGDEGERGRLRSHRMTTLTENAASKGKNSKTKGRLVVAQSRVCLGGDEKGLIMPLLIFAFLCSFFLIKWFLNQ